MTSTIKTKKELFDNIKAQLDDCSLTTTTKCKVLTEIFQQKDFEVVFNEEDGGWFASLILSHISTNGAGIRRVMDKVMERVC